MAKAKNKTVELKLPMELYERASKVLGDRGTDIETFVRLQLGVLSRSKITIRLTDEMPFGKYAGARVEDIIRSDPRYFNWLVTTMNDLGKYGEDVLTLVAELMGSKSDLLLPAEDYHQD